MFADKTAVRQKCDADWCNGSTADSDSVSRGSSPLSVVIGVWLSLVERYVRDVEVAGSNPVTPTPWQGQGRKLSEFPVFSFYPCLSLRMTVIKQLYR